MSSERIKRPRLRPKWTPGFACRGCLVAAALATFGETSYEAVTMTSVAERGAGEGDAYLYFGTKEDLFLSVVEDRLGDWFRALDAWLTNSAAPASPVCEEPLVVDFAVELAAMVRALLAG